MRLFRPVLLMAIVAVFAGCASTICYLPREADPVVHTVRIEDIVLFEQDRNRCGPAALATILVFSGIETSPETLEEMVYDPADQGSLQASLVAAARRHGRVAWEIRGIEELEQGLQEGHPVLVLLNKGFFKGSLYHYAVAAGFNTEPGFFILAGGRSCLERVPAPLFRRMWRQSGDWGLMVFSPSEIPPFAEKNPWVEAVYGIERAGMHDAALAGYSAALEKWPESVGAVLGKANALYALGRTAEAGDVLLEGSVVHPESGPILNNLAHVMLELGMYEKALDAAARAVETGGPHIQTYRETADRIRGAINP